MKRRLKLFHLSLVILISISIPVLSTYLDYSDLSDADFPSRDRKFENPDQVGLLVTERNEIKLFPSGFFSIALSPGNDFLEQFSHFTFQTPSSDQVATVLRC